MYAKLFSSITDSTIWREPDHVRLVWITLLAMSDKHGEVAASVPGLADRARVPLSETVKALEVLASPDEWSRSKEFEGRRIEVIGGGWKLLNYQTYRNLRDEEERRAYMRNYMRKKRKQDVNNVSNVSRSKPPLANTDADTDTEAEARSKATTKSEDSRVREDIENQVREVAATYPKITDSQNLSHEVSLVIAEAIARDGRDMVLAGTKSMAEQVAKWPKTEMRFVPAPSRYFRESQYLKNPAEWDRTQSKPNGKETLAERNKRAFDIALGRVPK